MKENNFFVIKQARLRKSPVIGDTLTHVPAGSVLLWAGEAMTVKTMREDGQSVDALWAKVTYKNRWKRSFTGWTYIGFLEAVSEPGPIDTLDEVVRIPDELRTPDPFDPQQYLQIDGKVSHNLCGQFCGAFVGDNDIDIFMEAVRQLSTASWDAGVKRDVGIGISTLENMLKDVYSFETMRFDDGLKDPIVGVLVSPGMIRKRIESGWMLIAGVKINGNSGKLISSGRVGHWVVLVDVKPYGVNDGQVKIYNPFQNRMELLSYSDFISSMRSWYGSAMTGLWVPDVLANISKEELPSSGSVLISSALDSLIEETTEFLDAEKKELEEIKRWLVERREKIDSLEVSLR